MIRNTTKILCLVLALCLLVLTFVACGAKDDQGPAAGTTANENNAQEGTGTNTANNTADPTEVNKTGIWQNATYTKNTTLGEGAKTLTIVVSAEEQSVTFTIKTDAETVGAALLALDLIAGEDSQYGLYVKTVNGMLADYNVDQTYWAFYKNGEYMATGVDATAFADGEQYELVRTK